MIYTVYGAKKEESWLEASNQSVPQASHKLDLRSIQVIYTNTGIPIYCNDTINFQEFLTEKVSPCNSVEKGKYIQFA